MSAENTAPAEDADAMAAEWAAALAESKPETASEVHAVTQGDLRLSAHRIADFVYEKLTGEKGRRG